MYIIIMVASWWYTFNHRITCSNCFAARSAVRVPQKPSRATPFVGFCSTAFCQPWSCFASPYSDWQNITYFKR